MTEFYADNNTILRSETLIVRGNEVSDLTGDTVSAYNLENITNLRAKHNKALRIRSATGTATGFNISDTQDAVFVYNVASRTNTGFLFASSVAALEVYNATAHNCTSCITTEASGVFRNIAFSAFKDSNLYRVSNGFISSAPIPLDVDYVIHFGLDDLTTGPVTLGDNVKEDTIIYIDEENDDLTPDYISELVNSGTTNPLNTEYPDIGGIESRVTTEATAARNYWYELIDNVFWNTLDKFSVESSFIRAFQSRVLANAHVTVTEVYKNTLIKQASSLLRFSELYPMHARYASQSKFKKRVMDMWFAGQNPAVIQSYQNGIGGYNLLPSFFKRMEDYEDGWIIGVSYVAYDNWLNSMEDLKYGIAIDVLGTSTMNQATSGECYNNIMNTAADIAPVRWFLHDEVQPTGYTIFTDMWNGFENCMLTNMHYNDDFNIELNEDGDDGEIVTPLISTVSVLGSGVPSGNVEVSLLDRRFNERVDRDFYYRQGTSTAAMSAWDELTVPIGSVLAIDSPYVQFKVDVDDAPTVRDYEFIGIGLRQYTSIRDWTRPQAFSEDVEYMELMPGNCAPDRNDPSVFAPTFIEFPNDGVLHQCGWTEYIPQSLRGEIEALRLYFASQNFAVAGTAIINYTLYMVDTSGAFNVIYNTSANITTVANQLTTLDIPLSGVITSNSEIITLIINRNSSAAGDTLASDLLFFSGRSI